MLAAPVADLAAHLGDLREALGLAPETESLISRYGFASYRAWLGDRIAVRGLAPLRLTDRTDPASAWVLGGAGEPGASLEADGYQLFRAISGRRRLEDVRSWSWGGDPATYLPLISPYPQRRTPHRQGRWPQPAGWGRRRTRSRAVEVKGDGERVNTVDHDDGLAALDRTKDCAGAKLIVRSYFSMPFGVLGKRSTAERPLFKPRHPTSSATSGSGRRPARPRRR